MVVYVVPTLWTETQRITGQGPGQRLCVTPTAVPHSR
jgi:hypothetical protein